MGFAALGPKRSEEPYSKNDVWLLQWVTAQTGLALDNARLTAFYGEYDPATKELNLVNGGRNPFMILRGEEWIHKRREGRWWVCMARLIRS